MSTSGESSKSTPDASSTESPASQPTTGSQASTEIQGGAVKISGAGDRIQLEFRIDDLIKRLLPSGSSVASCGGCNGCHGCSM